MRKPCKGRCAVIPFLCAIILITIGLVMTINQTLVTYVINRVNSQITLMEGTKRYEFWTSPTEITFKIYVFHVENPEDIMKGELPKIMERGPYVYRSIIEREVLSVNEEEDEITYNIKKTFFFNKEKSGEFTEDDEVVLLNAAYIGSINTLAGLSASFLKLYGGFIQYLFSDENPVFAKAKIKDLLFDGIPFFCDETKHSKMRLICMTLKGRKPPIVWNTDVENHYMYSLFGTINGTWNGPIIINRGVKNLKKLGQITSVNNKRVNKFWKSEECNTIKGTDGFAWPPMEKPPSRLEVYVTETCRTSFVDYIKESSMHGFKAWFYKQTSELWSPSEIDCYCPVIKKQKQCLPTGLLDINKCSKIPVLISEPHFLHGDPELLNYVQDLKPDEEKHSSFLVLDSFTGAPLHSYRNYQLNLKVSSQPLDLLANISDGYMPLIWVSEGDVVDSTKLIGVFTAYRMKNVMWLLQWLPILIGVIMIFLIPLCCELPRRKIQMADHATMIHSIFKSSNDRARTLTRRTRGRSKPMFKNKEWTETSSFKKNDRTILNN